MSLYKLFENRSASAFRDTKNENPTKLSTIMFQDSSKKTLQSTFLNQVLLKVFGAPLRCGNRLWRRCIWPTLLGGRATLRKSGGPWPARPQSTGVTGPKIIRVKFFLLHLNRLFFRGRLFLFRDRLSRLARACASWRFSKEGFDISSSYLGLFLGLAAFFFFAAAFFFPLELPATLECNKKVSLTFAQNL